MLTVFAILLLVIVTIAIIILTADPQQEGVDGVVAKKRPAPVSRLQANLCAELERKGDQWFGRSVECMTNVPVDSFLDILEVRHRSSLAGYPIDMVISEIRGDALLLIQLKAAPEVSSTGKEVILREVMANAGIPIAYLGEEPKPDALRLTISSMMRANVIRTSRSGPAQA